MGTDWHAGVETSVPVGGATITLRHQHLFGISIPAPPPSLGETSSNLKLISKVWDQGNRHMTLTLAGLAARSYEFALTGAENVSAISGAKQNGDHVTVTMPRGSGYQHATVQFDMK